MDKRVLADLVRELEPNLPDAAERIGYLLSNEPLYDMCVEHEECTKCLRRWTESPDENQHRIAEYMELLTDLRQEILQYLREQGTWLS